MLAGKVNCGKDGLGTVGWLAKCFRTEIEGVARSPGLAQQRPTSAGHTDPTEIAPPFWMRSNVNRPDHLAGLE